MSEVLRRIGPRWARRLFHVNRFGGLVDPVSGRPNYHRA